MSTKSTQTEAMQWGLPCRFHAPLKFWQMADRFGLGFHSRVAKSSSSATHHLWLASESVSSEIFSLVVPIHLLAKAGVLSLQSGPSIHHDPFIRIHSWLEDGSRLMSFTRASPP